MVELIQFIRRNKVLMATLAIAVMIPVVLPNDYILHIITICFILGLASLGWNFGYGYGGLLGFGHIAFFGLGGYIVVILLRQLLLTPWVGLFIAGALVGLFGMLIVWLTARTRGFYFALCTFVIPPILFALWTYDYKPITTITGGSYGISVPLIEDSLYYMQFTSRLPYYYITLVFVLFSCLLVRAVSKSKLGYRIRAMGENEEAAESIGINTFMTRTISMGLSAFITGIAGGIYFNYLYFIDPFEAFGWNLNLQIILASTLGGIGTVIGPLTGAFVLIPFSEFIKTYLEQWIKPGVHLIIYGIVLMLVIVKMPEGIYPRLRKYLKGKRTKED